MKISADDLNAIKQEFRDQITKAEKELAYDELQHPENCSIPDLNNRNRYQADIVFGNGGLAALKAVERQSKNKTNDSQLSRFDLEQDIHACWNIVQDIGVVVSAYDTSTEDEHLNMLIGLEALYNAKFDKLFSTMETLIAQQDLT